MGRLILIAGVSRSGKSSLAKDLCSRLKKAVHLDQDQFVKSESEIPLIRDRVDWETPESINWPNWRRAIQQGLRAHDYVIAEGIFAFADLGLIKEASITILLELEQDEFTARRKRETRWGEEPNWFIQHVWNSHLLHHNPHNIQPSLSISVHTEADLSRVIKLLQSN